MQALLRSLGDRAEMLDHLPFDQVVFEERESLKSHL